MNDKYPQTMDLTSLKAVISELRNKILPSKFELALQPDANTIQIGLRNLEGIIWIEISWEADSARIVEIPPPLNKKNEPNLNTHLSVLF